MPPFEYDRKRAMKQPEFTRCLCCAEGMMHDGDMFFYRVTLERMGIDVRAAQRQAGVEQILGGHAGMAYVMGEQADLGIPVGDAQRGLVCDRCAILPTRIAQLAETINDRAERDSEKQKGKPS